MSVPSWLLEILRSPETRLPLQIQGDGLVGSDGSRYPLLKGIPSLVHPAELQGSNKDMSRFYRWISPFYEWSERAGARHLLGMEADAAWADVVARLGPLRGSRLLEVSPGPGNYQPFLRTALGPEGQLVALDLSYPMLRQCGRQHAKEGAVLVHANGEHLPFMDACFDGLFHFGGINLFSRPSQALSEFVRVVKPGGLVAYGDEGFASDYPQTWRRTMLTRMNPGYLKPRPAPPAGITEVLEQSVCGGLGYLVTARKKKDPTLAQDPLGS